MIRYNFMKSNFMGKNNLCLPMNIRMKNYVGKVHCNILEKYFICIC
jgi:hypothetical protein